MGKISYDEAYKIIKEEKDFDHQLFDDECHFDPELNEWLFYLHGHHGIYILVKIMKIWKKNHPSKEVLEDFKTSINYKPLKMEDCFVDKIFKDVNIDKKTKEKIMEDLLYFGVNIWEVIKFHLDLDININKYIKHIVGLPSFIEFNKTTNFNLFLFDEYEDYHLWYQYLDCSDERLKLIIMFDNWDKKEKDIKHPSPDKILLEDFKKVININNILEDFIYMFTDEGYYDSDDMYVINECINYLIKYGALITENHLKILQSKSWIEIMREDITKKYHGQKIAHYIKKQMDDKYHLSNLRKKIELRRFTDLMKENE